MDYKHCILDFESVVADLSPVYGQAFSVVFEEFSIPYDPSELELYISTPLDILFGKYYKGCTCKYRDFVIMFIGEFDKAFDLAIPREGISEKLNQLSSNGTKIGVLAGVAEMYVDRFLTCIDSRKCVESIIGIEKAVVPRSETYAVKLCMNELGASPADTMIISASDNDRQVAEKLGIAYKTTL